MPKISLTITVPKPLDYGDQHKLVEDIGRALYKVNKDIAIQFNGLFIQDVMANRPPFGNQGRFFYSTDIPGLYYDTGTSWFLV